MIESTSLIVIWWNVVDSLLQYLKALPGKNNFQFTVNMQTIILKFVLVECGKKDKDIPGWWNKDTRSMRQKHKPFRKLFSFWKDCKMRVN